VRGDLRAWARVTLGKATTPHLDKIEREAYDFFVVSGTGGDRMIKKCALMAAILIVMLSSSACGLTPEKLSPTPVPNVDTFTITASAGADGTISPSGSV
jgi:hypothetical protein